MYDSKADTDDLVAGLKNLAAQLPLAVRGIVDSSLSTYRQVEFGDLIIAAGLAIVAHARTVRTPNQDANKRQKGHLQIVAARRLSAFKLKLNEPRVSEEQPENY